jgi:hypothetical protein
MRMTRRSVRGAGAGLAALLVAAAAAAETAPPAGKPAPDKSAAEKRQPEKPADGDLARAAYETEEWPAARKLVWASPGEDGSFQDARAWKDAKTGRPAGKPPDRDTDVVLPASAKPYTVKTSSKCNCRHIVVEKNALAVGYHNSYNNLNIWGNCWVKKGGRIHFIDIVGPKHTYLRVDNPFPAPGDRGTYHFTPKGYRNDPRYAPSHIHHKMSVCKYRGASVELLGTVGIGDEFYLTKGKVIIGPGAQFRYKGSTNKGTFEIFDGGTLEMQSGGQLAPFNNSGTAALNLSIYRGGTLQAGSPERPLTSDAYVMLGMGGGESVGLYAAKQSAIRVHTTDPKKARLVFTSINSREDFCDGKGRRNADAGKKAEGAGYGLILRFAGEAELNGVLLDYVRLGGVRLSDERLRAKWSHVFYGPHCAGPAEKLLGPMKMKTDIYYHKRRYDRYRHRVGKDLRELKKFEGGS